MSPLKSESSLERLRLQLGGWWPDLIKKGSNGSTFVQSQSKAIRHSGTSGKKFGAATHLWNVDPRFRKRLLLERDEARADSQAQGSVLELQIKFSSSAIRLRFF